MNRVLSADPTHVIWTRRVLAGLVVLYAAYAMANLYGLVIEHFRPAVSSAPRPVDAWQVASSIASVTISALALLGSRSTPCRVFWATALGDSGIRLLLRLGATVPLEAIHRYASSQSVNSSWSRSLLVVF